MAEEIAELKKELELEKMILFSNDMAQLLPKKVVYLHIEFAQS